MSFLETPDLLLLMNSYAAERELSADPDPTQEEQELKARIEKEIPGLTVMWMDAYETYCLVPQLIAQIIERSTYYAM